jgi:hypothetical protein
MPAALDRDAIEAIYRAATLDYVTIAAGMAVCSGADSERYAACSDEAYDDAHRAGLAAVFRAGAAAGVTPFAAD